MYKANLGKRCLNYRPFIGQSKENYIKNPITTRERPMGKNQQHKLEKEIRNKFEVLIKSSAPFG